MSSVVSNLQPLTSVEGGTGCFTGFTGLGGGDVGGFSDCTLPVFTSSRYRSISLHQKKNHLQSIDTSELGTLRKLDLIAF